MITPPFDTGTPAADRLDGLAAIAKFLGISKRRATYLAETKRIPVGRLGRRYVGSKVALQRHFQTLTGVGT